MMDKRLKSSPMLQSCAVAVNRMNGKISRGKSSLKKMKRRSKAAVSSLKRKLTAAKKEAQFQANRTTDHVLHNRLGKAVSVDL